MRRFAIELMIATVSLLASSVLRAEPVTVRFPQGLLHGFLVLRTQDGKRIADGDLMQTVGGDLVTSRLVFHFTDGSLQDETTVFSQREHFRVLTDHLVQKGAIFPHPIDMSIDARRGHVDVHYADDQGRPQTSSQQINIPSDLANGIIPVLLENVRPDQPPKTFSLIVATPDPRLVKLQLSTGKPEAFTTGGTRRQAVQYVLHVDIGGVAGLFAGIAGKQPPDSHVWVLSGEAPSFLKAEEPFYSGAPVWRIELVSPSWPAGAPGHP